MKVLFHLAHPAQYHMFKYVIRNLIEIGHDVKITINTKDILEQLLIADGVEYENILPKRRKYNTKLSTLFTLIKKDIKILQTQLKGNYDLMVGTETALSHIGWLFRKPVLIMIEDDISVVPEAAKLSFPFAKYIVSPISCDLGRWSTKKLSYPGYQKLAYLHPSYFHPNEEIVRKVVAENERYFLIRVSGLSAYHDSGINGFTEEILRNIVKMLVPYGRVLLSTEKKLPDDLRQYQFKTEVSNIHHFLYYSDFLIADSQSMCVEAAILGTPSIRFSDFAGRIGVLEELEHKYGLTYGVGGLQSDKLFEKIEELLKIENLRFEWQAKMHKMLEEKIDVTSFWTWLIDGYPKSVLELKANHTFNGLKK